MFRQQSENKSTKETVYSSIFSGNQTSLDSKRRSSAGVGADSTGTQSNAAPLITRRPRPDWAEPTVSVDQAAILKRERELLAASLERKGEATNITEKINHSVNTRIETNSKTDSNPFPSSTKSSNNNYNDHFQKVVSTVSITSTSGASSVAEHNLNAKMSFLNHTPVNGTMTGNGEASRITTRHTASNNESILKTSSKTTSASAASEESNNISTNSAISPNNNGMVNENNSSSATKQLNLSTTSGDSTAEPCV